MNKYYAVAVGRQPGIYRSWTETEKQVKGFKGAKFKSFKTLDEAQIYLNPNKTVSPLISPRSDSPPLDQPIVNSSDGIIVYTDGSCVDKVGGLGYVMINNGTVTPISAQVPVYPCTNQIAELYAIYTVLYNINLKTNITIYTDSKYSIGCLTEWHHNWRKNGWVNSKGEPVANKELIQAILSVSSTMNIKYNHVRAHRGDHYNEWADRLANEGRTK